MTDVIDAISGLDTAQSTALRGHRPDVVSSAQASYEALLPQSLDADPVPGFELPTRLLVAARSARLEHSPAALAHYSERLAAHAEHSALLAFVESGPDRGAGLLASRRERAILRHVELLVSRPAATTASDLDALTAAGLDPAEIVVLSQIVAFVSFQVRIAHGLTVLKGTL